MKLVIVIILDHREPELTCEVEHAQAPIRLQRNRRRKLMMRSQEDSAHLVDPAHALNLIDTDALPIQVDSENLRAAFLEGADPSLICKRLHQYNIAWTDQYAGGQIDSHLTS